MIEPIDGKFGIFVVQKIDIHAGGKLLSANLDRKNPTRRNETEYAEPAEVITRILEKEQTILSLLEEIKVIIG